MAIVFTSPRKKQRIILWIVAVLVLAAMTGISVVIFLPEIQNKLGNVVLVESIGPPMVNINFMVIDSEKVKNLELFSPLPIEDAQIGRNNPFSASLPLPGAPKK